MYNVGSEIVRAMIQKDSYGFNTFTGVRVGAIPRSENPKSFSWRAGEWNMADLTLGEGWPNVLGQNSTWQSGPLFPKYDKMKWFLVQKIYKLSNLPEVATSKVCPLEHLVRLS